jgi:7,8-dihydroneopterin aldolase/epimerase/oxygenase
MRDGAGQDSIRIYLRDCTVQLFVGIYDHEKPKPQPVIVHIEAIASLARRYGDLKSHNIASVIDYERLYTFVTAVLPTIGHVPLLESIAEHIIAFCFEDARIEEVRVRLDKPEAFKGKAIPGIEMRRRRSVS